jgi:hypothetical protein
LAEYNSPGGPKTFRESVVPFSAEGRKNEEQKDKSKIHMIEKFIRGMEEKIKVEDKNTKHIKKKSINHNSPSARNLAINKIMKTRETMGKAK